SPAAVSGPGGVEPRPRRSPVQAGPCQQRNMDRSGAGLRGLYSLLDGPDKIFGVHNGYLVEEALSVDNLFVFILLFRYFKVPPEDERTVLFWGIIGALLMRGAFILGGVALVNRFHWILYAFGAFLIYSGVKLMTEKDEEVDPSRN